MEVMSLFAPEAAALNALRAPEAVSEPVPPRLTGSVKPEGNVNEVLVNVTELEKVVAALNVFAPLIVCVVPSVANDPVPAMAWMLEAIPPPASPYP